MDDFDSSLRILSFLPAASVMLAVLPMMMLGPVVLYLIARWRANRAGTPDPHLGVKFAIHWFATTSIHVMLAAGAFLIFTIIGPGPSSAKGDLYRMAFAMLIPAAIIYGVHMMLLKRTNDQEVPGVRRLFLGYNVFVTGLVGFMALMLAFQMLFKKGPAYGMGHLSGSLVLVYCSAWAAFGYRLGGLVFGDWGGGQGLPEPVAPPYPQQQPPAAAAAGGGTALPPLGGGAYPPIEPR